MTGTLTQAPLTAQPLTKFQSIAFPLVQRGFRVTPVRPDAKAGSAGCWNHWQYDTPEMVLTKYVDRYADCNAGVVGMCGVGNLCFLDDDGGVPADVIAQMPRTYTVATRPDSSHKHYYLRQTFHSVSRFGPRVDSYDADRAKTVNVRDINQIVPSPSGWIMYKTLFDMKGVGGASLVVAAGSTKPNGDKYTCIDNGDVAEIPDWLVDWVLAQKRKEQSALKKVMLSNLEDKRRASQLPPDARERLRREGHSDGFDVFPIDVRQFLKSRAFSFAHLGVTGDTLINLLVAQTQRYVERGTEFCQTHLSAIEGIARDAEAMTHDRRVERASKFYEPKTRTFVDDNVIYDIRVPTRREILRDVLRQFPDKLTCEQADSRLTDAFQLVGVEAYSKRGDRTAVSDIRQEEGFEVTRTHWIRTARGFSSPPLTLYRDGTDMSCRGQAPTGH